MQPDLSSFDEEIERFDSGYAKAQEKFLAQFPNATPEQMQQFQALLTEQQVQEIRDLTQRYLAETLPAEIRFNVNPFVIWFWLGGIIGVGGALFALWPSGDGRRRRVSDVYGARLARDLSRT